MATFELIPPHREEWERRLATARERELPFLTAILDGEIVGYAYCAPWKMRRPTGTPWRTRSTSPRSAPAVASGLCCCKDCSRAAPQRAFVRSSPWWSTPRPRHHLPCTASTVSPRRVDCVRWAQARTMVGHGAAAMQPGGQQLTSSGSQIGLRIRFRCSLFDVAGSGSWAYRPTEGQPHDLADHRGELLVDRAVL